MPPELSAAERARRKRVLNSAIRVRQQTVARWSLYVRDATLERALARMREELAQLQGELKALDAPGPEWARQIGRTYLGGR